MLTEKIFRKLFLGKKKHGRGKAGEKKRIKKKKKKKHATKGGEQCDGKPEGKKKPRKKTVRTVGENAEPDLCDIQKRDARSKKKKVKYPRKNNCHPSVRTKGDQPIKKSLENKTGNS